VVLPPVLQGIPSAAHVYNVLDLAPYRLEQKQSGMPRSLALLAGFSISALCALGGKRTTLKADTDSSSVGAPTFKICIVGEALIDFLPVTAHDGGAAYRWRPGGAPFNVCIAAARLGIPTLFFGNLSTDLFGEELYCALDREQVDLSLVERLPRPTTLAFVSRTPGADVKYAFFKENAADRSLQESRIAQIMQGHNFGALHVSLGAVTLEDLPMAAAFSEAFSVAKKGGAFTSFDSNIREPMIAGGVEEYRARVEKFTRSASVAKSSDADIEFLYGADAQLDVVAARWLDLGSKLVVITCGAKGALAFFRDAVTGKVTSISASPPCQAPNTIDATGRPAPVADTVGAGDTCMGALLFGLLGGDGGASLSNHVLGKMPWDGHAVERLTFVLERSVACAAITCSRNGADPPTRAELDHALSALSA